MKISVSWNDQSKTLLYQFPQTWDWDDLKNALYFDFYQIKTVSHPVDVIFDLSMYYQPRGSEALYWRKTMKQMPDTLNALIFVSNNHFMIDIISIFRDISQQYQDKIYVCKSLTDAYGIHEQLLKHHAEFTHKT